MTPDTIRVVETLNDWHVSASGWWRKRGSDSLSRWRVSRQVRLCNECRAVINIGDRYVVSTAPPWHEFTTLDRWYSHELCDRHPDWAPPQ